MEETLTEALLTTEDCSQEQQQTTILLISTSKQDNSNTVTENQENTSTALKKISSGALKVAFSFFLNASNRNILLVFLKYTSDDTEQAAVTLGNSLMNVLSIAVFISMSVGLMNRLSHSFGAKNYRLTGFYLHRGFLINLILAFICSFLVIFSPLIFQAFGYNEKLLGHMREFMNWSLPSFLGFIVFQTLSSYLSAVKVFDDAAKVQIISSTAYWLSAYILIIKMDMGLKGAALALNVQQTVSGILIFAYCKIKNPVKETFFSFQKESFQELWNLFKYEFTIGAMIFLEWGGYELINLFAGTLSVAEVAGFMIALNSQSLFFCVALSINITTSSFIGNLMGEGKTKTAKMYLKVGVLTSLAISMLVEVGVGLFASEFAEFYSNDKEINYYTALILRLFLLLYPTDFVHTVLSGAMRAIGKGKLGSLVILVNLYVISIPMTVGLVLFAGAGIVGVGLAFVIGIFLDTCAYLYILSKADWEEQSKEIIKKLKEDESVLNSNDEENK